MVNIYNNSFILGILCIPVQLKIGSCLCTNKAHHELKYSARMPHLLKYPYIRKGIYIYMYMYIYIYIYIYINNYRMSILEKS